MNKIILTYILAVVLAVNFQIDIYFLAMSFILLALVHVLYKNYKRQYDFIKDILFSMSFIVSLLAIWVVFVFGTMYADSELAHVSYKDFGRDTYSIEGSVVDMKQQNQTLTAMLRVEKVVNLRTNKEVSGTPKYIEVAVSQTNQVSLFNKIETVGQIDFKNFNVYNEIKPFMFSYEYENLLHNTPYYVSQPKNILRKETQLTLREKLLVMFRKLNETFKNNLSTHMNEPFAGIAMGITLGDQENLIKDIKDIFKTSGLIHILVLSGANISFIISIIWFLFRKVKSKFKVFPALLISWIFIFVTGLTPPSVRAGVMSSTNILGEYFGKFVSPLYPLTLSLFILGLVNPLALVYSPSLHLSFLACFGIFILGPKIEELLLNKFEKISKFLTFLIATFFGIFVTTTPYILSMTGTSSLFGTLLTFLVEPFILITTILSFLIILTSFLNSYLADFLGLLNSVSAKLILSIAEFGANNLPTISFQLSKPLLIFYYLILLLAYLLSIKSEGGIIIEKE